MNTKQQKIINTVKQWAKDNDVDLTDTGFYTPEQWRDRGETWCLNADLIMTYEGGLYEVINVHYPALFDSFFNTIQSIGYWFECGTHWYCGFYPEE